MVRRSFFLLLTIFQLLFITGFFPSSVYGEASEVQRAVLHALARGLDAEWPGVSAEQLQYLFNKAEAYLQGFQQDHLPHGGAADVWWTDETRQVVHLYDTLGDSACWTGHYLAALAFKYGATKDTQLLPAIEKCLDWYDVLTRVSGIEGYVARYAGPADDPAYERYYTPYKSGHFRGVPPFEHLIWLGDSSRDSYDGTRLGLATVWKLVDDKSIQVKVTTLIERILDNLIANKWWIKDGQGHATRPTPTFQLSYLQLALCVNPQKYGNLQGDYDQLFEKVAAIPSRPPDKYRREYFAYNLDCSRMITLNLLETDPAKKTRYQTWAKNFFENSIDHVNAWFAAVYALTTGDTKNTVAQAILVGQLLDFPGPPNKMRGTDLTNDPAIEKISEQYAVYALDIRLREPDSFIWQRSPCVLKGGTPNVTYHWGGIDFFLPYWAGRYSGLIPSENISEKTAVSSQKEKLPVLGGPPSTDPTRFQFAILGDRTGGAELEWPLFDRTIDELNFLRPDFVLTVGDHIQGYTTHVEVIEQQWNEYKSHANRLQIPLYLLPGNHDVSNPVMNEWWKENLGKRYYAFVHKNCLFLILNIMEKWQMNASSLGEEQVQFALDTLSKYPEVRHTFVFLHMPLWRDPNRTDWQAIENALVGRAHTVIAGHTHTLSYEERNGGTYLVLGVTRGMSPTWTNEIIRELGQFPHYTWITVDGKQVHIAHVEPGSAMWPADVAPRSFQDSVGQLLALDGIRPEISTGEQVQTGFYLQITNKLPKLVEVTLDLVRREESRWQLQDGELPIQIKAAPGDTIRKEIFFHVDKTYVVPAPRIRGDIKYDGKLLRMFERNFPLYPETDLRRIPQWYVVGPFDAGQVPSQLPENPQEVMPKVFVVRGPEKGYSPTEVYIEEGKELRWHLVESQDGFVDFMHLQETPENVLAYATCAVFSPRETTCYAQFRADDYGRIAVNGEWIENNRIYRTRSDATFVALPLRSGWNSILVMCVNIGGGWSFRLLPADPNGELRFAAIPEDTEEHKTNE